MERSPLATLAALALVAVLLMVGMWLFALGQVSDTSTAQTAAAVDESLARSLEPGGKTRVTMVRDGTGVDAPRRYVVRYRPSVPVASDPLAMNRLADRIAQIAVARVENTKSAVLVHCVAALPDGRDFQRCFRRIGTRGSWQTEPVEPVPPLPAPAAGVENGGGNGGQNGGEDRASADDRSPRPRAGTPR